MASPEVDVGQLNESQQSALQQFISVTDLDTEAAVPILERSQWNVQFAIARFYDGEPLDPVAEAAAQAPPPRRSTHRETLLNGSTSFEPLRTEDPTFEPAPRVVPQPESQVANPPPFIIGVLLTPFNVLHRVLWTSLGFLGYLFPFLARFFLTVSSRTPARSGNTRVTSGRRSLNGRDTAARFIREFEEEYGNNSLPFLECGYAQTLDRAQRNLEVLLVILLSPEHDDTSSYIRETLLSQEVVDYIKDPQNNIILWGGSVQDSEGYQVSTALNCTKFPFAAVIALSPRAGSTTMSLVARLTGPMPPATFIAKIQSAVAQSSESLSRARATRVAQQAERNLREEQNSAFERSLAQDRERMRRKREAEAAKERAEREAREKAEAEERRAQDLLQWKKWRALSVRPEPGPDVKDATRISLKMPSGERIVRRFSPSSDIEEVYAFIECYDVLGSGGSLDSTVTKPENFKHTYGFRLVDPIPPRKVLDVETGGVVKDRIGRSANLFVEAIEEDDDNGDE